MIKKIALFEHPSSQYQVLNIFTHHFADALKRQGVEVGLFSKGSNPNTFLDKLVHFGPDATIAFNGLMPDDKNLFLSDVLQIPHLAYLVDSPHYFFPILQSSLTSIATIDLDFLNIFKTYHFPRSLFLPHAINRDIAPLEKPDWQYDIVMLNSFIDFDEEQKNWPSRYGEEITSILNEAAKQTLNDKSISYWDALIGTINRHIQMGAAIDPNQIDFVELLSSLEKYISGKSQIDLLNAIKNTPVHIFGNSSDTNWKTYLKTPNDHIIIHSSVSFPEAIEIAKRTKILLSVTPKFKQALHERILMGMACGSAVMTYRTPFLEKCFKDEESILFYDYSNLGNLNEKILAFLNDENLRLSLSKKAREVVLENHTWDQRAQTLLEEWPKIESRFKS